MYDFRQPDYSKGNIVNIMSSISHSFGKEHQYPELIALDSQDLKGFENIVLIVVDGLGYNYLQTQKDSFLLQHLKSKISSTFLSTTPCANTVFQVGYPPQQHALTGGTMNLKEIGGIVQTLRFIPMHGGATLSDQGFEITQMVDIPSLHKGFNGDCFTIVENDKFQRDLIRYAAKETQIIPAENLENTLIKTAQLINTPSDTRRFIHAYMDDFDSMQHDSGVGSTQANTLFQSIDSKIESLYKSVQGTNTKLIIVSDHGLLNIPRESEIWVQDIPGLEQCLTMPLTGEARVRNCFVRPSKTEEFKKIIKTHMSDYCWCFEGEQLINDNFYGLGTPHKKLSERVGDYVLIMKEDYALRDKNINMPREKALHGSVHDDEVFVPLMIIDAS